MRFPLLLAFAALSLSPATASAFCQTTQCGEGTEGARCDPESTRPTIDPPPDCGEPIYWGRSCIGFAVQQDGVSQLPLADVEEALQRAFDIWHAVDCGGQPASIATRYLGAVSCGAVEYNSRAGNVNVLSFREEVWPHEARQNALALTTVTYDTSTGEIYDADIEVNAVNNPLSVAETTTDWDLVGILTHEVGHFFGLSHSGNGNEPEPATMSVTLQPGSTAYRSLTPDDAAGFCRLFPPTTEAATADTCNPIPRHGFSPDCVDEQTHGDCSTAAPPRQTAPAWLTMFLVATLGWRRRRRPAP